MSLTARELTNSVFREYFALVTIGFRQMSSTYARTQRMRRSTPIHPEYKMFLSSEGSRSHAALQISIGAGVHTQRQGSDAPRRSISVVSEAPFLTFAALERGFAGLMPRDEAEGEHFARAPSRCAPISAATMASSCHWCSTSRRSRCTGRTCIRRASLDGRRDPEKSAHRAVGREVATDHGVS